MIRSSYSNGSEHAFSPMGCGAIAKPMQYTFSLDKDKSVRLEGLTVNLSENGDIWGASYDTGEAVRHNARYSMAKGVNSTLWLGDRKGMWHPVD